ncbi:MAG: putative DNA-binding domain-containing protein [Bacteriovoracia bacterium]
MKSLRAWNEKNMHSELKIFDEAIQKFPESALDFLKPPKRGSLSDRFRIYAEGYSLRTQSAMEEIFELLPKLIGEEEWHRLGGAYVRLRPSKNYSFNHIGESFPEFLDQLGVDRRWLAVADFELKIWHSFHAHQKEIMLRPDALTQISGDTQFLLQDSLFLFESEWNVAEIWKRRNSISPLENKKEYSFIFRDHDSVTVEIIDKHLFEFLNSLKTGSTLGKALDKYMITSEALSKVLHRLVSKEIIYGI